MPKISGPTLQIADHTLIDEAAEFLRDHHGQLPQLSTEIGIPTRFFYDLTSGRTQNPGVRYIEKILRYKRMAGETLQTGLLAS